MTATAILWLSWKSEDQCLTIGPEQMAHVRHELKQSPELILGATLLDHGPEEDRCLTLDPLNGHANRRLDHSFPELKQRDGK